MIGSFLTRGLVMVFGYAYPAYECYKAIEKNKPEIQQLRFWCQYWILVAALTIFERVGDTFASWVPLYCEAKLAFFIYLWFPKTRGTTYVYDSFFRPYVAKHENEIDRNLVELKTQAGDMAVLFCRKAVCYGKTRFTEILHFVALTSTTPKPQPKEKKQPAPKEEKPKQQPDLRTSQAASTPQASQQGPKPKKPLLLTKEPVAVKPVSSPRKDLQPQQQAETKEAQPSVSQTKLTPTPPPSPSPATKPNADSAQPPSTTEAKKESEIVAAALPASEIQRASSSKETIMEETLRVTRGSLRKARSTGNTIKEK